MLKPMHVYVHIHACVECTAYTCMCVHVCTCVRTPCMCAHLCMCMCMCVSALCMCPSLHVLVHCVCVHICSCVHICFILLELSPNPALKTLIEAPMPCQDWWWLWCRQRQGVVETGWREVSEALMPQPELTTRIQENKGR
jgi:hypothetical protein